MRRLIGPTVAMVALCTTVFFAGGVSARDPDGRYANSPLKQWFDQLASGKGLCCSFRRRRQRAGCRLGHAGRQLSRATARGVGRRARRGSGKRAEPLRSCGGVAVSRRERDNADTVLPTGRRRIASTQRTPVPSSIPNKGRRAQKDGERMSGCGGGCAIPDLLSRLDLGHCWWAKSLPRV
jgi:hypothetical protein